MAVGSAGFSNSSGFKCFKTGGPCQQSIKVDDKFVFVAMPFGGDFDNVYEHVIKPTVIKNGYKCGGADEVISTIDIMCKICDLIQQAILNIVDITSWNPNVLFELGMMYGMGKTAFLLKHKKDTVPVDLRGMEYIEYENFQKLEKDLTRYLTKGGDPAAPFLGKKCPECRKDFKLGDHIVICVEDQLAQHKHCWEKNSGCLVCKSTKYIS